jgi:hypothetical protein
MKPNVKIKYSCPGHLIIVLRKIGHFPYLYQSTEELFTVKRSTFTVKDGKLRSRVIARHQEVLL